jgi:hypothetical protein
VLLGLSLALGWSFRPAAACPVDREILGAPTNLTGTVEGIISQKFQEHMWVTADGRVHVVINDGGDEGALKLFSSLDGKDWSLQVAIPGTDRRAQSDGLLYGSALYLVYPSSRGELVLSKLAYDAAGLRWRLRRSVTVYHREFHTPDRPSIAIDSRQRLWIGFADLNDVTGETVLKLLAGDGGPFCCTPPITLGTRNVSEQKSVRLIGVANALVAVYTDGPNPASSTHTLNWAYRHDDQALDGSWVEGGLLHQYRPGTKDPHGAHFSTVADGLDQVHIVSRSGPDVIYFRISDLTSSWDSARVLATDPAGPYVQMSLSQSGVLYVLYPGSCGSSEQDIRVLVSSDYGETFTEAASLVFGRNRYLGQFRIASPTRFQAMLPVLRQIQGLTSLRHRLVYFGVDIEGP